MPAQERIPVRRTLTTAACIFGIAASSLTPASADPLPEWVKPFFTNEDGSLQTESPVLVRAAKIDNVLFQTNPEFYDFDKFGTRVISPWPGNEVRCDFTHGAIGRCYQIDNNGVGHQLKRLTAYGGSLAIHAVNEENSPQWSRMPETRWIATTILALTALSLDIPAGSSSSSEAPPDTIYNHKIDTLSAESSAPTPDLAFRAAVQAVYNAIPLQRWLISNYLNNAMGTHLEQ